MMKRFMVIMVFGVCFIGLGPSAKAQFWKEWFRQKATQREYLVQQIAALQVYSGYLKRGYRIARDGLKVVGDLKNGEFNLHNSFFKSLKSVNPAIKKYSKVGDIVLLEIKTVKAFSQALKKLHRDKILSTQHLDYLDAVYARLLSDCNAVVEELITLTKSGHYELKDDERLQRIDELYEIALDQFTFSTEFGQEALLLQESQLRELESIRSLERIIE